MHICISKPGQVQVIVCPLFNVKPLPESIRRVQRWGFLRWYNTYPYMAYQRFIWYLNACNISDLAQDCSISSVLAMELLQFALSQWYMLSLNILRFINSNLRMIEYIIKNDVYLDKFFCILLHILIDLSQYIAIHGVSWKPQTMLSYCLLDL